MNSIVYLATPYSHPNPIVRNERFLAANKTAAELLQHGIHVFSPISHTHPIALAGNLPTHWEFWEAYDRAFLSHCKALLVLTLPGWKESKGVSSEIAIAKSLGIPINYIAPNEAVGNLMPKDE